MRERADMSDRWQIICGDCVAELTAMPENHFDSVVTDPPYGLAFMGKRWDMSICGVDIWREVLRVAKPGAHLLAFGGTRTHHRLMCAIEDAGWQVRDCMGWLFGSGFPKSLDVSKAIDKAAGAEREVVSTRKLTGKARVLKGGNFDGGYEGKEVTSDYAVTAPATAAARAWAGWGTALKPAWEPIILARKPLAGTVAENVLQHGTGGINVDGCRVESGGTHGSASSAGMGRGLGTHDGNGIYHGVGGLVMPPHAKCRWPANVLHDGSAEVMELFPQTGPASSRARNNGEFKSVAKGRDLPHVTHGHDDLGGSAGRFFYCAKASKHDRDAGCEGLGEKSPGQMTDRSNGTDGLNSPRAGAGRTGGGRNHHPTVKPTALMRYLVRLITPPGGLVLDPFMGSGSTGKAALLEGCRFLGIEREADYCAIARARLAAAAKVHSTAPGKNGAPTRPCARFNAIPAAHPGANPKEQP
jgi:hypothetical protein